MSWTTFGFDPARSGSNPNETLLGTSNVGQLHQLWSFALGAPTVSQALLATNDDISASTNQYCSLISRQLTAGTYFVRVRGSGGASGQFRLAVRDTP